MKGAAKTAVHQKSAGDAVGGAVDRILDDPKLAALLEVKLNTLYSHICRGVDLPPFFLVGSQRRYRESEVWKWIKRKEQDRKRRNFES
jgi:predicted DNA-binding transcriptional regulator AlpA